MVRRVDVPMSESSTDPRSILWTLQLASFYLVLLSSWCSSCPHSPCRYHHPRLELPPSQTQELRDYRPSANSECENLQPSRDLRRAQDHVLICEHPLHPRTYALILLCDIPHPAYAVHTSFWPGPAREGIQNHHQTGRGCGFRVRSPSCWFLLI